ncbi:MAG: 2-polyprenyl-6-methoxyphenol hydroxylase [Streptosporangiales bacterium]|nr:2-polyprenyl-6-methoxyphenol hydroxylase [Streptosporangiales bacterium]
MSESARAGRDGTAPDGATTPVLIVGAGPVGAVLALELARHGVTSVLVDRALTASPHPKMDYINGRSMELLRRLAVTDEIRRRGVPPEHPFTFIWSRDFAEPPIATWHYSSVTELRDRIDAVNDGTMPAEPHQRLQGSLLEEILRARVEAHPLIDFRPGCAVTDLEEDASNVRVSLVESQTGAERRVRASYVIGCDGAGSTVRTLLDVGVGLLAPPTHHRDVYFRSSDPVLRRHGRAFLTIAAGGLTLVSRDERDTWTGTVHLADEAARAEDPVAQMRRNLGADFTVDDVLSIVEWEGSLGVADTYGRGRVFLAGDSVHHFYPTGGHGANTGIADAVDLGWKLAARLRGWGADALLASYQIERRPVALFNREMCANLLEVWLRFPRLVAAAASREQIAGFLAHETYQLDNLGIHFGYRYDTSPVVWHEADPSAWDWGRIVPTTWPGGRAPSVRLADGSPLFDRLGAGFTLVDSSGAGAGKGVVDTARHRAMPVTYLPLDVAVREVWERELVLVRPDHHVAWRGSEPPDDWNTVLAKVSGH